MRAELGAGIVGAAAAFHARRAGMRPLVVERRPLPASMTTAVAARGYRLQLDHREELDLVQRTLRLWGDVWRSSAQWVVQAGQYTMTPDQWPLIGETEVPGLFVNTGYSGHGVMAGPGRSELLAEVLAGHLAAGDNPFRLDRTFGEAHQAF